MKEEEHKLQIACVNWFRYQFPRYLIFSVPNGGQRNAIVAAKLKAEGAMAGVADLVIVASNKVLFIEMKTKKGYQSDKQIEFERKVKRLGFEYFVCHSLDEFIKAVKGCLYMDK